MRQSQKITRNGIFSVDNQLQAKNKKKQANRRTKQGESVLTLLFFKNHFKT